MPNRNNHKIPHSGSNNTKVQTLPEKKVTKLLQVVQPLRSIQRAYVAQLNKTNSKIEEEVLQARRKRRSTESFVNFISEIMKTFMGVF